MQLICFSTMALVSNGDTVQIVHKILQTLLSSCLDIQTMHSTCLTLLELGHSFCCFIPHLVTCYRAPEEQQLIHVFAAEQENF